MKTAPYLRDAHTLQIALKVTDFGGAGGILQSVELLSINDPADIYRTEWTEQTPPSSLDELGELSMYAVNVRNFSREGTFDAVRRSLPELRDLGVNCLWILPIQEIGVEKRKGRDGSLYAIRDYRSIDPSYGTADDFRALVETAHDLGFKVLLDAVMNHTSPDNVWVKEHLDWYLLNEEGNPRPEYADWTDIVDLDWDNPEVREECAQVLEYWLRDFNLDGFRCDVADMIPSDWWAGVRPRLEAIQPDLIMFAESQEQYHYFNGFDLTHYEGYRDKMLEIVKGDLPASELKTESLSCRYRYPRGAAQILFTENHDKPRAVNAFGGPDQAKAAGVVITTLPGVPLIYTGTEVGERSGRDETFFQKTPVEFDRDPHRMRDFWTKLLHYRANHPALQKGELKVLDAEPAESVFAFERTFEDDRVLVVVNLSDKPQNVELESDLLRGENVKLAPWGYRFFSADKDGGTVVAGNARFTVLSPQLIRLEWSPTGTFVDSPSFAFTERHPLPPPYKVYRTTSEVVIETEDMTLRYNPKEGKFSQKNLSIAFKVNDKEALWHPGMEDTGNLGGTTRTLDGVNGPTRLDPGLLSRDGWVLVDDSKNLLFDDQELPWAMPRAEVNEALDWTFFGHGHEYKKALYDFTTVAGRIPLPPRWSFGHWWSRYWDFSDQDLKDLIAEYRAHDVPLDVLVIDMDWHLVGDQYVERGWTGYTWNRELFPDPEGFLDWAHDQGLHTTLNLHPHSGVQNYEEAFPAFARAMGLDPATTEEIPFDCTDPLYMKNYFELLHHPIEEQGVDFWWLDWQQGPNTRIPGLDPLYWLNFLHWEDMARNPKRGDLRPFIFSRWGGLGNHRYQIGFSGDTHSTWESVDFQSYFTATASNVGYGFWSNDIGGHFPGQVDPEIYARWIQLGAFTPFLRTHATKHPLAERQIWKFPDEVFESARKTFHLRYALIPYIYSTARQAYDTGVSMCRPLYYEWPERDEAYEWKDEYMFGDQMFVAPVAIARDTASRCALREIWLPPGQWTNWFTGQTFDGDQVVKQLVPLDEMPVFVREGGIITTAPKMRSTHEKPLDPVIVYLFPGEHGEAELYEDDGETIGYQKGEFRKTSLAQETLDGVTRVTIGAARGMFKGAPEARNWELVFPDTMPVKAIKIDGMEFGRDSERFRQPVWKYDEQLLANRLFVRQPSVEIPVTVEIEFFRDGAVQAALRQGLRGRLNLLGTIAEELGNQTPESILRANAMRDTLESTPNNVVQLASLIEKEQALNFAADLAASSAPSEKIFEATARLLGLNAQIVAEGTKNPDQPIVVRAGLRLLEPIAGLSGEVRLEKPANWELAGTEHAPLEFDSQATSADATLSLSPEGVPQTTRLSARMTIRQDDREFQVPLEETLLPSINRWMVIGPFENPWENALDVAFEPESEIDFTQTCKGKNGKTAAWKRIERTVDEESVLTNEFLVDLHDATGGFSEYAVAYAVTYLDSPNDRDAVLAVGSDDGVAVWVNGEVVHRNHVGRPYTSRKDIVPVHLKKGRNELMLKISQGNAGWEFCAHLEFPNGSPMDDVAVSLP